MDICLDIWSLKNGGPEAKMLRPAKAWRCSKDLLPLHVLAVAKLQSTQVVLVKEFLSWQSRHGGP